MLNLTNTTKHLKGAPKKRGRRSAAEGGRLLSIREEEVLKHLGEGGKYTEIAALLFISSETVRTHAHRIYKKLGVKNRIQAGNKYFGDNRQTSFNHSQKQFFD